MRARTASPRCAGSSRADTSPARMVLRSCVACRRHGEQGTLVRLAVSPAGRLVVDHPPKLKGRGAYLCPDPACVEAATRRNPFPRALRREVALPEAGLASAITGRLWAHVTGLLGVARKAGRARSGATQVEQALARTHRHEPRPTPPTGPGRTDDRRVPGAGGGPAPGGPRRGGLALLVVAADAEPATAAAFEARARAAGTPVVRFGTKDELGRAIGKEPRAVVGIADPGLAAGIQDDLAKLRRLTGK